MSGVTFFFAVLSAVLAVVIYFLLKKDKESGGGGGSFDEPVKTRSFKAPPPPEEFTIEIVQARDLPKTDVIGKIDPFFVFKYGGEEKKTEIKKVTFTPSYNETFTFKKGQSNEILVELWDYDSPTKSDFVAFVNVNISKYNDPRERNWYKLTPAPDSRKKEVGEVELGIGLDEAQIKSRDIALAENEAKNAKDEADRLKALYEKAIADAKKAREEAEKAKAEAEAAKAAKEKAKAEAKNAKVEAEKAVADAKKLQKDAEQAAEKAKNIAENAKAEAEKAKNEEQKAKNALAEKEKEKVTIKVSVYGDQNDPNVSYVRLPVKKE